MSLLIIYSLSTTSYSLTHFITLPILLSGRHFGFVCIRLFERNPSIPLAVLVGGGGRGVQIYYKNSKTNARLSQNPSFHYVNHWWFTVNRRRFIAWHVYITYTLYKAVIIIGRHHLHQHFCYDFLPVTIVQEFHGPLIFFIVK